jgi:hypothetical protein
VGFSHNVEARTARRGNRVVVEAITRVQSVDLVADPATTRGLFESQGGEQAAAEAAAAPRALTLDDLKRDYPQLVEALGCEQAGELRRLEEELARLTGAESLRRKHEQARQLLREFHLPEADSSDPRAAAVTGPRFIESLLAAPDERAMRELVEERARLVRSLGGDAKLGAACGRPLSRDQHLADGVEVCDTRAFVDAIT